MSAEAPPSPGRLVDRGSALTGAEMVAHLVPPRQFAAATVDSYRPDRDYPSQGAAVAAIRNFVAGVARSGGGRLFSRKKVADPHARHLSRRRIRGRQDPPSRGALASRARPQVLRYFHRVHGARRSTRLRPDGAASQGCLPRVHRRVRARRSGRHPTDVPAARLNSSHPELGSRRPRTPRPTRSGRDGSPPRTSCGRSTRWPPASRRSESMVSTTVVAMAMAHARSVDDVAAALAAVVGETHDRLIRRRCCSHLGKRAPVALRQARRGPGCDRPHRRSCVAQPDRCAPVSSPSSIVSMTRRCESLRVAPRSTRCSRTTCSRADIARSICVRSPGWSP